MGTKLAGYIYAGRCRNSSIKRGNALEEFQSDRSRIVFCSSFRRMMQKAQVFSLESNSSVRNRLTHSLEVADVGKTLARKVGCALKDKGLADDFDVSCIEAIVENACLIHDIGNPPFGHFGEEAIKRWCRENQCIFEKGENNLPLGIPDPCFYDLSHFDGNPQGFRIVTKLHAEKDEFSLNLTYSTLLSFLKYPCSNEEEKNTNNYKKIGIFSSEADRYKKICDTTKHSYGKRYFLVYLMELADDICYCLSDIADAFEKRIVESRFFKEEFKKIIKAKNYEDSQFQKIIPEVPITNFSQQISIPVCRECIESAVKYYAENFDSYLNGEGNELSGTIEESRWLECLKIFARKFIYTESEIQRIEIAGDKVVSELLRHFGRLLRLSQKDFRYFCEKRENIKGKGYDLEWRIFNQLSPRMLEAYKSSLSKNSEEEKLLRCRFIVDYISGMTDQSALQFYQNLMAIKL